VKRTFSILFLLLFIIPGFGQDWKIFNTSNSTSPFNDYLKFAIDTANIKWFVKYQGMSGDKTVSFDNHIAWTPYTNMDSSGVIFNTILILPDRKNVLWHTTTSFTAFSFTGGVWTRYSSSTTGIPEMSGVQDLAVDKNNVKWFATSGGLVTFDDSAFSLIDNSNSNLPFPAVDKITFDKNDRMWITYQDTLAMNNGTTWFKYPMPFTPIFANRIVADSNANIWIANSSLGIFKFDGSSWTTYNTSNSSIPTNAVASLAFDSNNKLWSCYYGGLISFDGTTWADWNSSTGYPGGTGGIINIDRYDNKWRTSSTGVVVFNENGIVGVSDVDPPAPAINIFPNPAQSSITVEFNDCNSISIINVFGQTMLSLKIEANETKREVDVSGLVPGVYFLRYTGANRSIMSKFIKQ
jgi:hypothetical protein